MNRYDFAGRRAVITGGAQGIGYAVADLLMRNGAAVTLWDIDAAGLDKARAKLASSGKVDTDIVDITNLQDVEAATQRAVEKGPVDILVHSAGYNGSDKPVVEGIPEAWHRVIDINLHGTYYVNRAIATHMITRNYGRIVNLASIAGIESPARTAAYAASKAAVISFTRSLGKELAHLNIAVNSVSPAAARTRLLDQMSPEHVQRIQAKIARKRLMEVEDIASAIAWLVSEDNSFTTAENINIAGGRL